MDARSASAGAPHVGALLLTRLRGRGRRLTQAAGRADLHVHSSWSDGAQDPEAIVRAAAGRVDLVAITDHDEIRGALRARDFARAHPGLGVEVVVGAEISTLNGHLLGLYLEAPVPPNRPAVETIARIHDQGGLAVAAHPFHPYRGGARGHRTLATLLPDVRVDAIEVVNNAGVWSWLYNAWAAARNVEWGFPVTAGSDAHDVWYLGSAVTRFPGRDHQALRRALLAGRTRGQVDWRWSADKLPRHVHLQLRSLVRFLALGYRRRRLAFPEPAVSPLTRRLT
jgi:predicted metal-dependent phosphoesterase TrpH